ncbi:MAG: NAD(P)/FAD-dependent oxidoreductase [Acidimicrobiia bacterium]|nr:NAD(P)/FAD-dependent oxidoreductase [Acidimicrobiia bacterium]
MRTPEEWDAIVVGSGPGGLTCAAYLAASGRRVLVVERHDVAGGNCQVFRRHHAGQDYEFDVGLHYLGDCERGGLIPSVLRGVGLEGRIDFRRLESDGFDTLLFPDFTFRVPAGWDAYRQRLKEQFPDEATGIDVCLDVLEAIPPALRNMGRDGVDMSVLLAWGLRPLADLFAEAGLSTRAAAVIDHWSGLYGSGPQDSTIPIHAMIVDHYMSGGGYYPAGGGQVIPARLVEVVESCGGEVRTLASVGRIEVEEGHAVGVVLEDGTHLTAPVVVSNADYKRTVLELVDRSAWRPETVTRAAEAEMTLPLVVAYVIVDFDISTRVPNTNFFVFSGYDAEGDYERLEAGEVGAEPFAYISLASLKDPGNAALCPPGHSNFQVMTLGPRGYTAWGVDDGPAHGVSYRRNEVYRVSKKRITEALLDQAERALGPFRDNIVHIETATPLTQERYTRSTGGTSYGLKFTAAQTGPLRPGYRTEIEGLYLVGASTVAGHGIAGTMVGGVMCAGEILGRDLMAEVGNGDVLVDPSILPPVHDAWDPVEVSRGATLRERREAGRAARATSP